jgi:serine/threonine protein phosphatase PrpC
MLRPKARKAARQTHGRDQTVRRRKRSEFGSNHRCAAIIVVSIVLAGIFFLLMVPSKDTSTIPLQTAEDPRPSNLRQAIEDEKEASTSKESEGPRPSNPIKEVENLCEDYGCPIYPSEFEDVQDQIQAIRNSSIDEVPPDEFNMAMLTRQSNRKKPPNNQDAAVLLQPFSTKQTTADQDFLLGIFDGHGMQGHHVAKYAAKAVPEILARKFNDFVGRMDEEEIIQALNETFIEVDINAPPINAMYGGSTASVTLRRDGKLYLANTGDSRTIIVSTKDDNTPDIPFMTRFDKAHLPEEKARIESMGGTIKYPENKPQQSRVWVYSSVSRETIGLAMSRSIGDWEWGDVGVIAEPLVNVLDVTDFTNAFVLAASDGMWDIRKPQFFANQFAASLSRRAQHPLLTCYEVIDNISPKNPSFYRDDISMIAMKLVPSLSNDIL